MTRRLGSILIAIAGVGMVLVDASDAEARRRLFGGGSWGSNGGSWGRNGSHGSWGGNGSFGGRWRARWNCGSHGGNGSYGRNGSHGGVYHNGHGSHGGSYHVEGTTGGAAYYGTESGVQSAQQRSDVRYYGRRNGQDTRAPAPIYMEGEERTNGERDMRRQRDGTGQGTDRGPAPPTPPDRSDQGPSATDQQDRQDQGGTQQPNDTNAPGTDTGAST